MNWLDAVLALILAVSVISGLVKGFVKVGIGLAATIAGVVFGAWFYGPVAAFFQPYVSHRGLANFIGFTVVFVGFVLLGGLLAWALGKLLKWAGLGWLDRLAGAAVGFVRAVLIAIVLVMLLLAFVPKRPPQAVVRSRLAPYVIDAAHVLSAIAPRELRDGVADSYEKVKQIWAEMLKHKPQVLHKQEI